MPSKPRAQATSARKRPPQAETRPREHVHPARSLWRDHGLSIVLCALFLSTMLGQAWAGWYAYNNDQEQHGERPATLSEYLRSGHFGEATFENWESEFLQMAAFVLLTVFLFQRGSAESKDPDEKEDVDADARAARNKKSAPWPVRSGGLVLKLYENSLSLTFVVLFLLALLLHGVTGLAHLNEERLAHGEPAATLAEYMGGSEFWFESLQNWQSEFLSLLAMVILTIFLRQRGSPESKPVAAPTWETGSS